MKTHLALVLTGAALFLAMPAHAAVLVTGEGPERGCYLAAKTGAANMDTLKMCTDAFSNSALFPHDRGATYVNRGVILAAMGRMDAAMADFDSCIKLIPDLADAYLNRGVVYIARKQYDQALGEIQKGFELKPTEMEVAYYDRAIAEEQLGRLRDAYLDYQASAQANPSFKPASDALARFKLILKPRAS